MAAAVHWLAGREPLPPRTAGAGTARPDTAADILPYRIELWDSGQATIEAVLALATTSGIAYAAFYAAMKDHPERYITLRLGERVIITSVTGPGN